uniref:Uncharacterized protein n=1 Tax=Anguilla anguilla TaxID=7936 RepID=A0A0E9U4A2_ANGAN
MNFYCVLIVFLNPISTALSLKCSAHRSF